VCTHFLQPCATPTLRRLGLVEAIERAGGVKNDVDICTPFGWIPSPIEEHGYNIRRQVLDPMLRDLAAETPGVELRMGHAAKGLLQESGRVVGVKIEDRDGATHELRAQLVVGADGRHSKIAEMAGLEAETAPNNRFLYAAYYKNLPPVNGTRSHIWFCGRDAAYHFPNDGGLTCVAVMPHKDALPAFRGDLEGSFRRLLAQLPRAPKLDGAERVSDFFGMLELPNHARPASAPGIALVGDAAMTSDPLFGVGCGWALQTGEWLADDVGEALASKSDVDAALSTYREHHAGRLRMHHQIINGASHAKPFNPFERLFLTASVKDRAIAKDFGRVGARIAHPKDVIGPKFLIRALWATLTKRVPADARVETLPS
jgi:flavin-dependent dehydrogenase